MSQEGEGPSRDVPILIGSDHVLHRGDLVDRQLVGERMWAGEDVVKLTSLFAFPGVVATRGEPEESKRRAEGEDVAGSVHGTEYQFFLSALWHPASSE